MLHMYTGSAGLAARLPKGTSFLVAPVNCAKRRHESRLVPKATATYISTILVSEATELHFRAAVEQLQHAKPTVSVDGAQAVHEDKGMTARFLQSVFGEKHTSKPARLKAVLAVFTATWCGPCSLLYKELRHMAALLPDNAPVSILFLDVDVNQQLATELGVKALPTLLFLGPNGEDKGPIFTQGVMSGALVKDALLQKAALYAGTRLDKDAWVRL